MGKNTSINDVDFDTLHKEIPLLKERTNSLIFLSNKSLNNSNRLTVITE